MTEKKTQTQAELQRAWVALGLALGPRSRFLKPLYAAFADPAAVLAADRAALAAACPDMGPGVLAALTDPRMIDEAERILSWCRQNRVSVLTPADAGYPGSLFDIAEPPASLYCKGLPLPVDRPAVGLVGTRKIDAYSERVTYKLSFELAAAGAVIVSGMAAGVDGIAAAAALDAGGHTVAVLGCGIDMAYPRQHERLMREICEYGTVLSEYAPGTRPNGWNFPMRNRIISALSGALAVVAADETSGALITARYALLQGKPLFAVPGDIDRPRSAGTNALIRAGAIPVLSSEDVLAHFRFVYQNAHNLTLPAEAAQFTDVTDRKLRAHGMESVAGCEPAPATEPQPRKSGLFGKKRRKETPPEAVFAPLASGVPNPALDALDPREREIYAALPDTPFTPDHMAGLGVSVGDAVAMLTVFEIYGLLQSLPGGQYQKK